MKKKKFVILFDEKLLPFSEDIINIIKNYVSPKCCGTTFRGKKFKCNKPARIYPSLYDVDYMDTPMCMDCEIIMRWEYDI